MSYWLDHMDDGMFEIVTGPAGHGPYATELEAHEDALSMLIHSRALTAEAIRKTRCRIRACRKVGGGA